MYFLDQIVFNRVDRSLETAEDMLAASMSLCVWPLHKVHACRISFMNELGTEQKRRLARHLGTHLRSGMLQTVQRRHVVAGTLAGGDTDVGVPKNKWSLRHSLTQSVSRYRD